MEAKGRETKKKGNINEAKNQEKKERDWKNYKRSDDKIKKNKQDLAVKEK